MLTFIEGLFQSDGLMLEECEVYPSSEVKGIEVGAQLVVVVLPDRRVFSVVLLGYAKGPPELYTDIGSRARRHMGIRHSCLLPIRNLSSYASLVSR